MQIKRFSELDDNILEKIIHKHFVIGQNLIQL